MFVVYCTNHAENTYRMLNPKTKKISITRKIKWLNRMYNDKSNRRFKTSERVDAELELEIPEGTRDVPTNNESEEGEDKPGPNSRVLSALKRLETSYNSTSKDMVDIALVGGTKYGHKNPVTFQEAWYHKDKHEREKWRLAIKKELESMIEKKVWENSKKCDIPEERRLIGYKCVFKVKENNIYRARLVALGYSQISGINHGDNFSPVITEVTFRVAMVMMLMNDRSSEIVDVETSFRYRDLDEEIFMKFQRE